MAALTAIGAVSVVARSVANGRQAAAADARVGIFWGSLDPEQLRELRRGLAELVWIEGQNITFVERVADGTEPTVLETAADLARSSDVVVSGSTPLVQAIRLASPTTPVVLLRLADPVSDGFATTLARPGGMVTGVYAATNAVYPKRVQLLHALVPSMMRPAVLWSSSRGAPLDPLIGEAADKLGLPMTVLDTPLALDVGRALQSGLERGVDGLIIHNEVVVQSRRLEIAEFASDHRLPAISIDRRFVELGGFASYGANFKQLAYRAATYVDRVLRGAGPGDLPIEEPTTFDFVVNAPQVQSSGLAIPSAVAQQITEWA